MQSFTRIFTLLIFVFPVFLRAQSPDTALVQQYLADAKTQLAAQQVSESLESYQKAAEVYEAAGDWDAYVEVLDKAVFDHSVTQARDAVIEWVNVFNQQREQEDIPLSIKSQILLNNTQGDWYNNADPARGKVFIDKALELIRSNPDQQGLFPKVFGNATINAYLSSNYEQALAYADSTYHYAQKKGDRLRMIKINALKGAILSTKNEIDASIEALQAIVPLLEQDSTIENRLGLLADCRTNLANNFLAKGDFTKAREMLESVLSYYQDRDPYSTAIVYNNLGICHRRLGDLDRAAQYYQESIVMLELIFGDNSVNTVAQYDNISTLYSLSGDLETGFYYARKALAIRKATYGLLHPEVAMNYLKMASFYLDHEMVGSAKPHLDTCFQILSQSAGVTPYHWGQYYAHEGHAFALEGHLEAGIKSIEKGLTAYEQVEDTYNQHLLLIYLGEYRRIGGAYEQSLEAFEEAMALLAPRTEMEPGTGLPSFEAVRSKSDYLDLLQQQGFTWLEWYFEAPEADRLDQARLHFERADSLIRVMRADFPGAESREEVAKVMLSVKEGLIASYLQVEDDAPTSEAIEAAFRHSEGIKAISLLEDLRDNQIKSFAHIPDSLIRQERQLEIDIAFCQTSIYNLQNSGEDSEAEEKPLYQRLFQLQSAQKQLEELFKADYPDYYQLKYDLSVIDPAEVQQKVLEEGEGLLEYFVGDNAIYVFLITPTEIQQLTIPKDFPLEQWVQRIDASTYSYFLSSSRSDAFYKSQADSLVTYSYYLYQRIFEPLTRQFVLPEKLIIVPDGVLGYLSFEQLLQSLPDESTLFGTHDYLLRDFEISYSYSASLLQKMQQRKVEGRKNFIAFAPSFGNDQLLADNSVSLTTVRAGLGALLYNTGEVQAIQSLIGGEVLLKDEASRENFLRLAPDYRLIHLATHGKANDKVGDYSFLAFSQGEDSTQQSFLYNRDLYNLQLQADMVVLSACETGIGELQRGEGIVSLARGFSYAGAKSIVTSLWSVNDAKTKELMEAFYRNLNGGRSKDAALRQAKLEFLEKYSHDAHPFYWAAFIPVGDMAPVDFQSGIPWWVWGAGLFIIAALFLFFVSSKKKQTTPR